MSYDTLRHLADSWGLVAMAVIFVVLSLWPFLPHAAAHNRRAATSIFDEDQDNG